MKRVSLLDVLKDDELIGISAKGSDSSSTSPAKTPPVPVKPREATVTPPPAPKTAVAPTENVEPSSIMVRTTITLPVDLSNTLIEYCHKNKMARQGDTQQSQVIRKALEMYFDKLKVK